MQMTEYSVYGPANLTELFVHLTRWRTESGAVAFSRDLLPC